MPESPERDPVVGQSLSLYIFIGALLLMVTLAWALYDEFFGLRPWKSYQRQFVRLYTSFLQKQIPKQRAAEKEILASAEYAALKQKLEDANQSVTPQVGEIERRVAQVEQRDRK